MTLVTTARGSHHTTEFKSSRATGPLPAGLARDLVTDAVAGVTDAVTCDGRGSVTDRRDAGRAPWDGI